MRILGYSERGIINSIIYNIGDDLELLKSFINLITLPNKILIGAPVDYTFLIEQSFSQFGSSDLILILNYDNPENKKVIFFEAKVKTVQGRWCLTKHFTTHTNQPLKEGSTSNLFYQLYLKKLMVEKLKEIAVGTTDVNGKLRRIGKNDIVRKAVDLISNASQFYYVGIVPVSNQTIRDFIADPQCISVKNYHFVSWESIYAFCKHMKLEEVMDVFSFNQGQIF